MMLNINGESVKAHPLIKLPFNFHLTNLEIFITNSGIWNLEILAKNVSGNFVF